MEHNELVALNADVIKVQQALWDAMPRNIPIIAVIIALAEMQKVVAMLHFAEEENKEVQR